MRAFDRFCNKYERFGIRNLIMYIVAGNVLLLAVSFFPGGRGVLDMLALYPDKVRSGEIWRLITFVFLPEGSSVLTILTIYFYAMIGRWLEREWGSLKFSIYYLTGVILTAVFCMITGGSGNAYFLNMSMFLALATLYPDFQILLFFAIPVKIKWLAVLDALFFLYYVAVLPMPGKLLPLVAVANYFLYFYTFYVDFLKNRSRTAEFRSRQRKAYQGSVKSQGYSHRCAICEKTDAQFPNLDFRYCSQCADYSCYCELHIENHEHR